MDFKTVLLLMQLIDASFRTSLKIFCSFSRETKNKSKILQQSEFLFNYVYCRIISSHMEKFLKFELIPLLHDP